MKKIERRETLLKISSTPILIYSVERFESRINLEKNLVIICVSINCCNDIVTSFFK